MMPKMSTDEIVATLAELDNYTVGFFPNILGKGKE